jgi:hypothetical protein
MKTHSSAETVDIGTSKDITIADFARVVAEVVLRNTVGAATLRSRRAIESRIGRICGKPRGRRSDANSSRFYRAQPSLYLR